MHEPLEGLHYETGHTMTKRQHTRQRKQQIKHSDQWEYFGKFPRYKIHGKYLFFSQDRQALIDIAEKEIGFFDFDLAKINRIRVSPSSDWVLCLYYRDESRKWELASRYRYQDGVHFRYWKSDEKTRQGVYSGEFVKEVKNSGKEIGGILGGCV